MRWSIIRLVAGREITERSRSRALRISTVLSVLLVIAMVALPALNDDEPPRFDVALVGSVSQPALGTVYFGAAAVDGDVRLLHAASEDAAAAGLRTGRFDLALVDGEEVVVHREPDDGSTTARFLAVTAEGLRLVRALTAEGLSPREIGEALSSAPVTVRTLAPGDPDEGRSQGIAFAGGILLYLFISIYGTWVLYGVAEEKSSRVVEVLLGAVRPAELLGGKILGIGILAFGQGALSVAAALLTAEATGSDVLSGAGARSILAMLAWLVLGYAFYASVYGAAGALVARQEDVQNVATPVAIPLLLAYLVAVQAAAGDDTILVRVFSLLPFSAPVVMPARAAAIDVPAIEVVVAVVLTVAGTLVTVRVAGTVYRRAILRAHGRVRWRDALRASS